MNVIDIKKVRVGKIVHPLIKKRWSPRAFSEEKIPQELLDGIFEAASCAPSAMNEQPWKYVYAERGTPGFDKLWSCLMPGNQPWTKKAPVIFVAIYNKYYENNGRENTAAEHDLGMANANLLMQAVSQDIYGHLLGGFDAQKTAEVLNLDDEQVPFCMGVLGYLGDPEQLEEPYKSREQAERSRKELKEFVLKL